MERFPTKSSGLQVKRLLMLSLSFCALGLLVDVSSRAIAQTDIFAQQSDDAIEARISRAIEELGDSNYTIRRRAAAYLWGCGERAEAPLERAAKTSRDAEVVFAARKILTQLRYGLTPRTPPEVAQMIRMFIGGEQQVKTGILDALINRGETALAVKLIEAEPNAAVSSRLSLHLLSQSEQVVPKLLIDGNYEKAERFLRLGARNPQGVSALAAFLHLTGRADEACREIENRSAPPTDLDWDLLSRLHRLAGRDKEALAAAEQMEHSPILCNLLIDTGDWTRVALYYKSRIPDLPDPDDPFGIGLGESSAIQEMLANLLAGNRSEVDEAIKKIVADKDQHGVFGAMAAMLIAGRPDEAIAFSKSAKSEIAMSLLAAQGRYEEALKLAGFEDPAAPRFDGERFFEKIASEDEPKHQGAAPFAPVPLPIKPEIEKEDSYRLRKEFAPAIYYLNDLGEHETAVRLTLEMFQQAKERKCLLAAGGAVTILCGIERDDLVIDHFDATLFKNDSLRDILFRTLFDKGDYPDWLYKVVGDLNLTSDDELADQADRDVRNRLRAMYRLLKPTAAERLSAETLQPIVKRHDEYINANQMRGSYEVRMWLTAVAEIYEAHGHAELAAVYRKKIADLEGESAWAIYRRGANLLQSRQWLAAAECFRKAAKPGSGNQATLFLFLQGYSLVRAGKTAEGKQLIRIASVAALDDLSARSSIADMMDRLRMPDSSAREYRTAVRLADHVEYPMDRVAAALAMAAEERTDWAEASQWRTVALLSSLGSIHRYRFSVNSSIVQRKDPVVIAMEAMCVARAEMFLSRKDIDRAYLEVKSASIAQPMKIDPIVRFVPRFEAVGRTFQADDLFDRTFYSLDRVCKTFPSSKRQRIELARLCARLERRLDDGLARGKEAVEIAPEDPAAMSALAEVHIARGEMDLAQPLVERCLEKSPTSEEYQALQRKLVPDAPEDTNP